MLVIKCGEIWRAPLREPFGSEPGFDRPVLILQSNEFNATGLETVIAAAITSNLRLAAAPGNVMLKRRESRLEKDSVVNVSQLVTVSKSALRDRVGAVSNERIHEIEAGLRTILALGEPAPSSGGDGAPSRFE